jgi:hypothetical protein
MSEDSYTFINTAKFLLECFDDCGYTKQDRMVVSNIIFKYINKNNDVFDSPKYKKFMYSVYEKIHEFEDIENDKGSFDYRTYCKFKSTIAICKNIVETRLRNYCKEVPVKKILSGSTSRFPNVIKFYKKYEEEMEKERLEKERLEKERLEKERLKKEQEREGLLLLTKQEEKSDFNSLYKTYTKNKKPDRCVGGYNLRRLERKDYSKMF